MLKKYAALMLMGLIINLAFGSFVFAQDAETKAAEKIKVKVARLGVGGKLIEVKLKDKTKIKGYITEIKNDYFVSVSKKNGASTNISYNQVKSVESILLKALLIPALVVTVLTVSLFVYCATGRCENP